MIFRAIAMAVVLIGLVVLIYNWVFKAKKVVKDDQDKPSE